MLLVGIAFGLAVTWPRLPSKTHVVFVADGESKFYHRRVVDTKRECPYEPLVHYATAAEAEGHGLRACPECFSGRQPHTESDHAKSE